MPTLCLYSDFSTFKSNFKGSCNIFYPKKYMLSFRITKKNRIPEYITNLSSDKNLTYSAIYYFFCVQRKMCSMFFFCLYFKSMDISFNQNNCYGTEYVLVMGSLAIVLKIVCGQDLCISLFISSFLH